VQYRGLPAVGPLRTVEVAVEEVEDAKSNMAQKNLFTYYTYVLNQFQDTATLIVVCS
jgi:hypothetical protein